MKIAIHQPDYFPYLGYFYKMSQADLFVFLDDAQFSNDNMHNWNKVKTPDGFCRMKVPVEQHMGMPINQVRTRDELGWKERHLRMIQYNYSKAPYFHSIYPEIERLINHSYANLAEMNMAIVVHIARKLGIIACFLNTACLKLESRKEERVLEICRLAKADTYISGNGARAYQVEDHFTQMGIRLQYTNYHPIEYKQQWGEFQPNMSVLDYIFNCGYDFGQVVRKVCDMDGNGELHRDAIPNQ